MFLSGRKALLKIFLCLLPLRETAFDITVVSWVAAQVLVCFHGNELHIKQGMSQ